MATLRIKFVLFLLVQCYIGFCSGMCDQRQFGGKMKCCTGKDSKCFVKTHSDRTRGQANTICYCDEYCKFTKDCCTDIDKIRRHCRSKLTGYILFMCFIVFPVILSGVDSKVLLK